MILTGRAGLLALVCVVPIALSPSPTNTFAVLLVALVALVAVDVALAAGTRTLRYTRSPDRSARLAQPVDVELLIHNDGRRAFRGQVRDAWPRARAPSRAASR